MRSVIKGAQFFAALVAMGLLFNAGSAGATEPEVCAELDKASDQIPVQHAQRERIESGGIYPYIETIRDPDTIDSDSRLVTLGENKLREAIDDAIEGGVSVGQGLDVTDYGLVGVDLGIQPILPCENGFTAGNCNKAQRRSQLQQDTADELNVVWVRSIAGAKARVNYGTSVGDSGPFVSAGFGAGTEIQVTTERPYTKESALQTARQATSKVVDSLKDQVKRRGIVSRVPFDAKDFEDCVKGEVISVRAPRYIRLNYGAGYRVGRDVGELAEAGASASIERTLVYQGWIDTDVECINPGKVKITLRDASRREKAWGVNAFAGLTVDRNEIVNRILPDGLSLLEKLADSAVDPVADVVEDAATFRYNLRSWDAHPEEVLATGVYDLHSAQQRGAYEQAMRGDFVPSRDLSKCDNGVAFETTTSEFDQSGLDRRLKISLHEIHSNRWRSDGTVVWQHAGGTRTDFTSKFCLDRDRSLGSAGNLCFDVVVRTNEDESRDVWTIADGTLTERFTTKNEFKDPIAAVAAVVAHDPEAITQLHNVFSAPPDGKSGHTASWIVGALATICTAATGGACAPSFLLLGITEGTADHWGKTQATVAMKVNEKGLRNIVLSSEDEIWRALIAPLPKAPLWADAARRPEFDAAIAANCDDHGCGHDKANNFNGHRHDVINELSDYKKAKRVVDEVLALKDIPTLEARARAGRDIAESFRQFHLLFWGRAYNYQGLAAMSLLATRFGAEPDGRDILVNLTADDGKMAYEWSEKAESAD